jgi:hypothetical protein
LYHDGGVGKWTKTLLLKLVVVLTADHVGAYFTITVAHRDSLLSPERVFESSMFCSVLKGC